MRIAVRIGLWAAAVSRRCGLGSGGIVGGRLALALAPEALAVLSRGRSVVLVTGTNGKTTTAHLLAAAVRAGSPIAHNATGANMTDGAVAALIAAPDADTAILEVDELHLPVVARQTAPAVVCLLNLTRDQLDRGNEVRAVGVVIRRALAELPSTTVVADVDDPMVVWAAGTAAAVVWVATGSRWRRDATSCPACGDTIRWLPGPDAEVWRCPCGLHRPSPDWTTTASAVGNAEETCPVSLELPGRANRGNAAMAMAVASVLGVHPRRAATAMSTVIEVDGRYSRFRRGRHRLRLLLSKNPAGWAETLDLLSDSPTVLIVVNASEADGRDVSWIWDVGFESLRGRSVACAGDRGPDVGLRLSYAGVVHDTARDFLDALALLPPGPVDVAANYTAFHEIRRRLARTDGLGAE